MFGPKEKSNDIDTPVVPLPHRGATTAKDVSRSASKDITTLIGEGCKVEGNFYVPNFTRIDGIVKGDLHGDSGVIIGTTGKIEGNIFGTEVVLYGEVKGKVETQKLELKKGSVLNGDIVAVNLVTESGCVFNGHCSMNENVQNNVTELSDSVQSI